MNWATDYEPFQKLLDGLCATWDRPPAKDELVAAYWGALKDASYAEIRRNVDRLIKTATRDSKWPRPGDLRDQTPSVPLPAREAEFKAGEERCTRNWDERLRKDPELTRIELAIAKTDRIIATVHESSPIYATAFDENWRYRQELQALREDRRQMRAEIDSPVNQ